MSHTAQSLLPPDRFFGPDGRQKEIAQHLYGQVAGLPLVCPHGHVDPRMFADPNYSLAQGSPADLLIIPDHYVFRMLYSQGVPLEALGVPRRDGGPVETDHRKIWQTFADHFYLFRGTPTGVWLAQELVEVFGVEEKLNSASAMRIYDQIADCLTRPEFRPRALFERFNIEVLATTDAAADPLLHHQAIKASGWKGRVVPTFRPDAAINIDMPGWRENIDALSAISKIEVSSYRALSAAFENRRAFFKQMGATATDSAALVPATGELSAAEAEAIFARGLKGQATAEDAARFTGHMLMEMARMSIDDGLVMQIHAGCCRNHDENLFRIFGPDKGGDIPVATEYVHNMKELLNAYGSDPRLTVIVFTLDETTYARELAPLAGFYPAMKLGPAWWFHDSIEGMLRYRSMVTENSGFYNTAGFNDDTRALVSIPARHDLSRRIDSTFLASLVARHIIDTDEALELIYELANGLVRKAYKLTTKN